MKIQVGVKGYRVEFEFDHRFKEWFIACHEHGKTIHFTFDPKSFTDNEELFAYAKTISDTLDGIKVSPSHGHIFIDLKEFEAKGNGGNLRKEFIRVI